MFFGRKKIKKIFLIVVIFNLGEDDHIDDGMMESFTTS
jgi:hypothetical protein